MTKKQIVQISILVLFLYLGVYALFSGLGLYMNIFDYEYSYFNYFSLITVLLLSAIYIMSNKKDCKFSPYIRLSLYLIVLIIILSRISMYCSFINFYSASFNTDFLLRKIINHISSFIFNFDIMLAIIISGVLIINKAESYVRIKIGKTKIKI